MVVFAFLSGLLCLATAVPVPQETTTSVRPRGEHYYLHRWRGEKVKVYCDARMAGFDISKVKIVWRLQLRFLSDSGCNPRDPVITLVELVHIQGKPEEDQIYHSIKEPRGWTFHADGAALNADGTNARSAWVGLTLEHAKPEHSGTFRCDALVSGVEGTQPKTSKSSYTVFTVSGRGQDIPDFSHMTIEESMSAIDYDSSVIKAKENHRRAGQPVNITCAPRLMKNAPPFLFTVSHLNIRFLPFHLPGSQFTTVAQYSADDKTLVANPPVDRKWEISHVGTTASASLRINIRIQNAVLEDTGIFVCAVTKASTRNTYIAEVGLKVSDDPTLQSGYCDPSKPDKEGGGLFRLNTEIPRRDHRHPQGYGSGPNAVAAFEGETEPPIETLGAPEDEADNRIACVAAVCLMSLSLILLFSLGRKQLYSFFCCGDSSDD